MYVCKNGSIYCMSCCFRCSPDIKWRLTTQLYAPGDCLTEHNLVDVCGLMVHIPPDSLGKFKYGIDLAIFPALAILFSSTISVNFQEHKATYFLKIITTIIILIISA